MRKEADIDDLYEMLFDIPTVYMCFPCQIWVGLLRKEIMQIILTPMVVDRRVRVPVVDPPAQFPF